MHEWLEWARGPAFRFAFCFMFLALLRLVILNLIELRGSFTRAGDKNIHSRRVVGETVGWFLPFGKVPKKKVVFVVTSMLFHVALIVTPVFLGAHVLLWKRGLGMSWPALGVAVADTLTVIGIATGLLLFGERLFGPTARALSRAQDYILLGLIIVTFSTGYLAMHPQTNPLHYDLTMFVHVMAGNVIFVFLPFSKLSHAILFPFNQMASELGWHLVPGAGRQVAAALGKENEPI